MSHAFKLGKAGPPRRAVCAWVPTHSRHDAKRFPVSRVKLGRRAAHTCLVDVGLGQQLAEKGRGVGQPAAGDDAGVGHEAVAPVQAEAGLARACAYVCVCVCVC